MWLWAWFTGGGWILVAGGLVVLGLVAVAVVVGASARKRDYAGRHVPQHPPGDPVAASDFYGSMGLEDERALYLPDQDAREQMLADLSPEALDEAYEWANYCTPHCPDDTCRAFGECAWRHDQPSCYPGCPRHDPADPGPGVPALVAPGPDLPEGWRVDPNVPRSMGMLTVYRLPAEPPPPSDLGPNAARVLARYERRFQERWSCRLASVAA